MKIKKSIDLKGLACPMPVVKTKQALDTLESGQVLEVEVTDKGALKDFLAWANASKHEIVDQKETGDTITFYIKKG